MSEDRVDILVVDDLPDKLLAYQVVLEELGQNLVLVRSGAEALRELLQRDFALIILDVNMPDIDGIETAELIRQHRKTRHIPIIFVTAYADEMQTARGYELGAVDYILSPVIPEILRSKVRVFVELYRAQRRAQALARLEAERAAAEEATRRAAFLADASRELGASLDLEEGMARFLRLLVPRLAAFALLAVQVEDEALVMSCDGAEPVRLAGACEAYPPALLQAMSATARDARKRELHFPADSRLPRRMQVIPLRAGGHGAGVVAVAQSAAGSGEASDADQASLDELVSRAAIAFDNARLYWNLTREMARTKEAEEKLQQASRRKDEFLAMLSHELRNPLAPIRNAAEVLRRIAPGDTRIDWARDVVERQVTHLAQLVDDLLDVSRITQGKVALRKERLELSRVIEHSLETVRPLFEAKRHRLSLSLPAAPIWVHGDFARLSQVVGNLLGNAAKYTAEGGRVQLEAAAHEGEATVTVRDNGIGIDSELLPRVFELFTQGERSLDRSQGGLGVGLTVVQRLVELHLGRVEAASDGPGKGALFRVRLPCVSGVSAEPARGSKSTGVLGAPGKRILVVDDNGDAAESIAVFLRLEGHDVRAVHDGSEALQAAQVFAPQVAVVDIGLPGMDGYELARRLGRSEGEALLLIALTGYGQTEDRTLSEEAGFHFHFVKPADPRLIQSTIAQWKGPGADAKPLGVRGA